MPNESLEVTTTYNFDYDTTGHRTSDIDDLLATRYTFDAADQLCTVELEKMGGGIICFHYSPDGQLSHVTDDNGHNVRAAWVEDEQ